MDIYTQDQVISATVAEVGDQTVTLAVQTMSETAYFLAGARLRDDGERRNLELIRCRVGKTCVVDLAAMKEPGTPGPALIMVQGSATPIDLVYKDGSKVTLFAPE